MQEMKMMHPSPTPTPMPTLAPTLRPPPALASSELEVESGIMEVLLEVPVCSSPFVESQQSLTTSCYSAPDPRLLFEQRARRLRR
ncbi:hypothetical protein DHEL01_v202357 [Diaporthe helianthi]|uniref:Uncharacterized protein n=1 Tax=Diaporthe helianthi TaxID=158607 RepID=A0A2P5I9R6_DIAHE|nr:hypothetical protein DHEL01_v202357 [Diaporthe helianthi]